MNVICAKVFSFICIMEVGTEISQKIRSAIKAKLLELGSYVDDELPDYIMVMVANKKTRSQMNSDLGLFLGTNTIAFTEWLHGLLEKLQTIRIEPDKYSDNQGKIEKHRSAKDKKKDKEKSHNDKGDSSGKSTSTSKDKLDNAKKITSECNSSDSVIDSKASDYRKSESVEEINLRNDNIDELGNENTAHTTTADRDSIKMDYRIDKRVSEIHKNTCDDFEDVRQLLVTAAAEDELTEELETTEVEVVNSKTVKDGVKSIAASSKDINIVSPGHSVNTSQAITIENKKPENCSTQELKTARKRKAPTSVVATVSRKEGVDEEYDPHNPAVGTVASVVRVTARKSSIPPMLQANSLLLLKAMTEAERSVAIKKKVFVNKSVSRDNSPAEVYSPKRKRSDKSRDQESPPLYIPSRKESIDRRSASSSSQQTEARVLTHDDARHVLNRDGREVASRSRREMMPQTVVSDRESSRRQELSSSPERSRRQRESEKPNREVKSGRDLKNDKNFKLISSVSSDSRLSVSLHVGDKKRRHSPSLESKNLQITFSPKPALDSKTMAARLGKIVIERIDLDEDSSDTTSTKTDHLVTSTGQRDAREDIIAKIKQSKSKDIHFKKQNSGRIISSLGKEAVQKQCQAAVISVQAAKTSSRIKRNMSPDSRVVECDTQSTEEEKAEDSDGKSKDLENKTLKITPSVDVLDTVVGDRSPGSGDDDDLAKMIDEDLGPELLHDTNGNFSLDLDIDDDLSNVVGITEEEIPRTDIEEHGKDEKRSGTRFIVTLDGVDERHFHGEDNAGVFDKFKHPPSGSVPAHITPLAVSNSEQQNRNLYLDHVGRQDKSVSQAPTKQIPVLAVAIPSKLTPPKIQPFSISLKDSDDEHDDKEGKPSASVQEYYQSTEGDVSALKRIKMSERCKFWPACAAGSSCEYHHPTAHCKTFPNCKFGDKCLFIHPNCRFDSKCVRPDCPYTHTSRRPALASATHMIAIPQTQFVFSTAPPKFVGHPGTQTECRYFPNCHNMNCPFLHPKHCKFGVACKSPSCPFYHPPNPGWNKLKWQASGGQVKVEVTTSSSSVKQEPSTTSPNYSAAVSSTSQ